MLRKSCLLFAINGHPDAIVAHPHLQLYWVVEYVTRRWRGPRSRVGAVEASVYGPRVWLFRNRAARYSRFDSGDFASETVKVSAKLPWWQPSIVNRKETLNEELVAEDETETSWWVWSCDKCVVWFDFFFFYSTQLWFLSANFVCKLKCFVCVCVCVCVRVRAFLTFYLCGFDFTALNINFSFGFQLRNVLVTRAWGIKHDRHFSDAEGTVLCRL